MTMMMKMKTKNHNSRSSRSITTTAAESDDKEEDCDDTDNEEEEEEEEEDQDVVMMDRNNGVQDNDDSDDDDDDDSDDDHYAVSDGNIQQMNDDDVDEIASDSDSEDDDDDDDDEEEEEEEALNEDNIVDQGVKENERTKSNPNDDTIQRNVMQQQQQQQHSVSTMLSKSWNIQSIYQPIYTGGKCTVLCLPTTTTNKILVSQVFGNVCFVNVNNHQQLNSIQDYENYGNNIIDNNADDDRDSSNKYDRNAITTFAIVPVLVPTLASLLSNSNTIIETNKTFHYTLVTCTQNNTMRIYSVQIQHNVKVDLDVAQTADTTGSVGLQDGLPKSKDIETNDDEIKVILQIQSTTTYIGHTLPVTSMEFHTSHIFLATASVDSTVRIWDLRNCIVHPTTTTTINKTTKPYMTHIFRPQQQQAGGSSSNSSSNSMLAVTCISWVPSIHQLILAIGRDDGSITIHNLRDTIATTTTSKTDDTSKKQKKKQQHQQTNPIMAIAVLHDHISAVTSIVWDIDHSLVITSGRDSVIHLWKYTKSTTTTPKDGNNKKKQIIQTTNPITTAPTSYTRVYTIPVYEQVEGLVPVQHHLLNDTPTVVTTIASVGTKGQIRFWDITSKVDNSMKYEIVSSSCVASSIPIFGEKRGGYTAIQSLFSSEPDPTENDVPKRQQQQFIVSDAEQNITFCSLRYSQDTDKRIQPLQLQTDRTVIGYNDEILDLKILPNPHSQQQISAVTTMAQHTRPVSEQMVVVTNSNQIRIFDVNTLRCDVVYDEYHTATILGVDVSPCGRYIATCSKDHTVRLWCTTAPNSEMNDGSSEADSIVTKCIAVGIGHTDAIGSVALSRKVNMYDISGKAALNGAGAFCVTVSVDRTIKRWNLPGSDTLLSEARNAEKNSTIQLTTFSSAHAHDKDINIVAIAPNDSIIATGSQDKTVKIFKSTNLSLITTLKGHRRGVWDVCFSPYDRIVATGSGDKTIKLWSLNDYSCVRTFQGHLDSVLRVRFLSGGLQLVSSGADGLIKLWTVRTNETEATLDGHTDRIWALDLTKDRKQIISGGADSQIVVWKDTTIEMDTLKLAVEEEAILVDQKLANHLRRKEYGEALKISLERDKPHHTLKVLNAMIETDLQNGFTATTSIKSYVKGWNNEQLMRVLRYCREWNTRSRNSHVAMLTLKAITTTIPVQTLAAIQGVPEIVAGIIPYMERHFDRLDRLHASSYLFDFALSSMGVIDSLKDNSSNEYSNWEANTKLVLPPKTVDGRIDVGGKVVVGVPFKVNRNSNDDSDSGNDDDESNEIVSIGDSEDSDDE